MTSPDFIKKHTAAISFRDRNHLAVFHANLSNLWFWPLTTVHVNHHHTKRKHINTSIVARIGYHRLWWHVRRSARYLCHAAGLHRAHVENPGHTQIRNFSCQIRTEQHIIGGEISMNDGRLLVVKVAEAQSHIVKNGVANLLWKDSIIFDTGGKICRKVLHDQHWSLRVVFKVYTKKLDDIGVMESAQKVALLLKVMNSVCGAPLIKQKFVDLLASTFQSHILEL